MKSKFSVFCTMNKAVDRFLKVKKATHNTISKMSDSLLIFYLSLQTLFLNDYIKNKIITKYNIASQKIFFQFPIQNKLKLTKEKLLLVLKDHVMHLEYEITHSLNSGKYLNPFFSGKEKFFLTQGL